ncbi:hypothetical protein [Corallococcus exercitus]|uniref:hypothetical protein n=1 Tax=Corallococcus exercitus TaxID=2316736 RepID=UPI0035D4A1AD
MNEDGEHHQPLCNPAKQTIKAMHATKKREFRTAFIIDEPSMEKLDQILSEFGPRSYSISYTDGLTLNCGDSRGFKQQPNNSNNQIIEILVSTPWQSTQRAAVRLRKPENSEVSSIDYDIAGEEKDVFILSGKLDQWIAARRPAYAYLSRWELIPILSATSGLMLILMALIALPNSESAVREAQATGKPLPVVVMAPPWAWVTAFVGLTATWLRNRVMPISDFAIGDGAERSRRLSFWRNTVILASLLGIATSVLTGKLTQ